MNRGRRAGRIAIGLLLALCVATAALALPLLLMSSVMSTSGTGAALFSALGYSAATVALFGGIPGTIFALMAEWQGWRHRGAYVATGVTAVLPAAAVIFFVFGTEALGLTFFMIGYLMAAGATSALVYWYVAGRYSGEGRRGTP